VVVDDGDEAIGSVVDDFAEKDVVLALLPLSSGNGLDLERAHR
jgi:hypothetical protein